MAVNWNDFEIVGAPPAAPPVAAPAAGAVDWSQFTPVAPAKPEGLINTVGRGIKESFQQVPQLAYGVGAGIAAGAESLVGEGGIATSLKKSAVEGYKRWEDKIAEHAQANDSIDTAWGKAKEGDIGALVDWLAHGIGYTGGQAIQTLATGGIGYVAGKATAMGAAKAIASGMIGKESARIAETRAGKEIIASMGAEKAAEVFAKEATAHAAGVLGQTAALGVNAFGMEGGEIFGDLVSKNKDRPLTGAELGRAFGATIAAGGLEFVGDKLGLDVMTGKLAPKGAGMLARVGASAAAAVPVEAGTEFTQTLLEEYGKGNEDTVNPFEVSSATLKQARESAALGALGGGVVSVGAAIPSPSPKIVNAKDTDEAIEHFKFEVAGSGPSPVDFTEVAKTYKDHTPEETSANQKKLEEALSNDITFTKREDGTPVAYGAALRAVAPQELPLMSEGSEGLSRDAYEVMAAINKAEGKKTVVYEDGGELPDGLVQMPDVVFISNKTSNDAIVVSAHELDHLSDRSEYGKVLQEELTEQAMTLARARHDVAKTDVDGKPLADRAGAPLILNPLSDARLFKEIRADIAGDAWADPTFHGRVIEKMVEQLGEKQAEASATTLLGSIKDLILRVKAVLTGTTFTSPDGQRLATQYVKNIERVHDALAAAIADKFIQEGYKPPGADTNSAELLAKRAAFEAREAQIERERAQIQSDTRRVTGAAEAATATAISNVNEANQPASGTATSAAFEAARVRAQKDEFDALRKTEEGDVHARRVELIEGQMRDAEIGRLMATGMQKAQATKNAELKVAANRDLIEQAELRSQRLEVVADKRARGALLNQDEILIERLGPVKAPAGSSPELAAAVAAVQKPGFLRDKIDERKIADVKSGVQMSPKALAAGEGWRVIDGASGTLRSREQAQAVIDFRTKGNSVVKPLAAWQGSEFRVTEDPTNKGAFLIEQRKPTPDIQSSPKSEKAKIEAARATNQGTYLNVGLSTKELVGAGTFIHQTQIAPELAKFGVKVIKMQTHGSKTEPTAVVRIDRPLTAAQIDALSAALNQEAIPQLHNGSGVMGGPKASAWGPFNPEYFIMPNGKTMSKSANVFPITSKKGRLVPEAIDRLSGIQSAIELAAGQKFATGRDFKLALQDRLLAAAKLVGVDLSQDTPAVRDYLRRSLLSEVLEGIRTNPNAIGWYDEKVTKALRILSVMHPEIITNPESKFAFIWALAVTSNGMKVNKNFELAELAYRSWKETGGKRFAMVGEGPTKAKINAGLTAYETQMDKHGFEALSKIMLTKASVREIEEATGIRPSGESINEILFGAAILGPKIGNGFFMNLNGEFGQLTMDRWWQRMWGRLTGTLILVDKEAVAAAKKSFTEVIDLINSDADAKDVVERDLLGRRLSTSNLAELAEDIRKATSQEHVRELLTDVLPAEGAVADRLESILGQAKKGKPYQSAGDELRKAALRYWKALDGQKEAPTPADRRMMRSIAYQVLDQAQQANPELTMADLQAILWYPEKRVYDSAGLDETGAEGYEDSEAPDYANAAAKLARDNGISEERIQQAIREAEDDIETRKRARRAGRDSDRPDAGQEAGVEAPVGGRAEGAAGDGREDGGGVSRSPKQGQHDLVGVHFSGSSREALSGRYFGTGMKGAEVLRVVSSPDKRLHSRVYAYVNNGTGVHPERYVGGQPHTVQMKNLYDATSNPLGLPNPDSNTFESAVLDAGFDGYFTRGDTQDIAVLMGPASNSVAAESKPGDYRGTDLPKAPAVVLDSRQTLARDISTNKLLPAGQMTGAEWKTNSVLQKMVDGAALNRIADSRSYYRDGIAKAVTNPRPLADITVKVAAVDTDGVRSTVDERADVALREVTEQRDKARELLECLGT